MPGFVKILTASDIPEGGKNAFNPVNEAIVEEEVWEAVAWQISMLKSSRQYIQ